MHVLKVITHWFSIFFLSLFLVLALVVLPASIHLTNRQSVKSWVGDPGLLNEVLDVAPTLLAQSQSEEELSDETAIQLLEESGIDTDQLVQASKKVLTPVYISEKLNIVIDGFYDWLEGETPEPEFEVLVSDRFTALADTISEPLKSELNKLPTCPSTEFSQDFNPITANCLPSDFNVDQVIDDFKRELTQNEDMVDVRFSSEDLELDEAVLQKGPTIYSQVNNLPLYLAGGILLFAVLSVILAKSIFRGIKRVGWMFVGTGLVLTLSYWILSKSNLVFRFSDEEQGTDVLLDNVVTPLVKLVVEDISRTGIKLSLAVAAIGGALVLGVHTFHKVQQSHNKNAKVRDTTPSEKQETSYINKITKKKKK